jgi:hypothetical protein
MAIITTIFSHFWAYASTYAYASTNAMRVLLTKIWFILQIIVFKFIKYEGE